MNDLSPTSPPRAVIYARYSSDHQREASIEDQVRLCRERAGRKGWTITRCYSDFETSGASLIRPGIQQLMQDAMAGQVDLVVAESLDRISRDLEDVAGCGGLSRSMQEDCHPRRLRRR